MNYPVWDLAATGGGLFIALIAITHVFVAHFAVGGGFFLLWTEWKAYVENDAGLLEYVVKHTRFFLLVTMVLGALTGVGIWLAISAVHPGATSVLIHTFVFAWAAEWAFFLVEIVSLFIYYYTFKKMSPRDHLNVAWIYFIAAWLSLFIINGIIGFMFTPGRWPETGNFWHAFFNPSFWPSLFFRSALALMLAGAYGLVTAVRSPDKAIKEKLVRYCAWWLLIPFVLILPTAWWYLDSIPPAAREIMLGGSKDTLSFVRAFLVFAPLMLLIGLYLITRRPRDFKPVLAAGVMVVALLTIGSFEYIRETGRRPYVIYGYMYSNGILKDQLPEIQKKGILKSARWSRVKSVKTSDKMAAGQEIFNLMCLSCHSVNGPRNDILKKNKLMSYDDLFDTIAGMGQATASMPPFPGTPREAEALTLYLTEGLNKGKN